MFYLFQKKRIIIILSLIYFSAHGLLLFVSGRWWDDWITYNVSDQALYNVCMEIGRPSSYVILEFTQLLPQFGYRWITFIMMYLCIYFIYIIIKNWLKISDENCFWICALYAIIPTYDARIVLGVFPYNVGYFSFMAGMCYFSGAINKEQLSKTDRIVSYILFVFGFTLNSVLCFYGIVLLMILMKKGVQQFYRYIDFILFPIIFYAMKSYFFPVYGGYSDYNVISLKSLVTAVLILFPTDFYVLQQVSIYHYMGLGQKIIYTVLSAAIIVFFICNYKKFFSLLAFFRSKTDYITIPLSDGEYLKENILILAIGIMALSAGIFPYVVVRQTYRFWTTGLGGRDAILVPFGAAMTIYAIISLVTQKWIRKYCLLAYIFAGIAYFNIYYLSYQQDYYRQLGLQYQLSQYKAELEHAKNIIYLNSDRTRINIQNIYQLNGNSELVFGNQSKFLMGGFKDTKYLSEGQKKWMDYFVESGRYHMSDYDRSHKRIDAVIQYSFNASLREVAKMKVYELIGSDCFYEWLSDRSSMTVLLDGTDEYTKILKKNKYLNLE